MASPVSAIAGSDAASTKDNSAATSTSLNASPEVFLQLLVAQIKDQDPLNPTDSVQFVSQLAQFSQLEQVMAIRKDIEAQQKPVGGTASTGASAPSAT